MFDRFLMSRFFIGISLFVGISLGFIHLLVSIIFLISDRFFASVWNYIFFIFSVEFSKFLIRFYRRNFKK